MNEFEGSPKTWPPLGLPTGSIRALLTLIVVAVVVTKITYARDLDALWIETLLIAMAHYFTSRRFVSLSPDVLLRLEQEGVIEKERQPLYLPKNSIRTIIVGAFVGLGIYLFREHRILETQALALLSMVFAYLFGGMVRGISYWWNRRRAKRASGTWGDLKALVVLGGLVAMGGIELFVPDLKLPDYLHHVVLGMTLFYFGSR